jgi:diguanylate cyclase (GGDEF)-like protein/PAS domain S-box-containing protein
MPRRSEDCQGASLHLFERLIGLDEQPFRRGMAPPQQVRLDELERFRSLLENISDVIFVVDMADGTLVDATGAVQAVVGLASRDILGRKIDELLLARTARDLFSDACIPDSGNGPAVFHSGLRHADGTIRPVEIKASRAVFGGQCYGVLVASDTTERMRAEERLRESEIRYRTVADHTYDMECWQDPQGKLLYVSPSSERITGYPPERFLRNAGFLESLILPDDRDAWALSMRCPGAGPAQETDFRIRRRDGSLRWVTQVCRGVTAEGRDLGLRFSLRDVTERRRVEEQLRHQALHDPLTGLANRVLCLDRIRQAMRRAARREGYCYGVVFMDLDGFRVVNQSLGHETGDALLVEVARRLRRCVRHLDTLSRFGSDEFVLVLEELDYPGQSVRAVKRVREALARPLRMNGREVRLTASYGIVSVPRTESRPEEILQHANIAMHRAKDKGRDRLAVFTAGMLAQAVGRLDLENDLRRALGAREFVAHFQPLVGLADGRVRGFEALARWAHPQRGLIPPAEFIPLAEETGLIHELGMQVLDGAVRAMSAWLRAGLCSPDAFMSVNLSACQFSHRELVRAILDSLESHGLHPGALNLEITESAIMEDPAAAIDKLTRLKEHGIRLSVDDFGTGYSSMSYLKRFPLDHLKIDLSFVRTIDTDTESLEIVKAIVSLAHSLRLSVVGEGVERAAQGDILRGLGCEFGQGYHFSRPLGRADAEAYLATHGAGADSGA